MPLSACKIAAILLIATAARSALPADIMVFPVEEQTTSGPVEGPMNRSAFSYRLLPSTFSEYWEIEIDQPWLTPSAESGVAYANGPDLILRLNELAYRLPAGEHVANIRFFELFTHTVLATRRVRLHIGNSPPEGAVFWHPLNADLGWGREGEWSFGPPQGEGGGSFGNPDPSSAHTGINVFGVNLDGDVSPSATGSFHLTTESMDLSDYQNVHLEFWRWLNSAGAPSGESFIEYSINGMDWAELWRADGPITDNLWSQQQFDLSSVADRQPRFRLRFGYETPAGASLPASGWNLDDLAIHADPTGFYLHTRTGDGGSVVRDHCKDIYPAGAEVQVKAAPDDGKGFLRWDGDLSAREQTLNPISVTVDDDKTIEALYVPNTIEVSPSAEQNSILRADNSFTQTQFDYQLRNAGSDDIEWRCETTALWLIPAQTSGMLQPGDATSVAVSLDEDSARLLGEGEHSVAVQFINETTGARISCSIRLSIGTAPPSALYWFPLDHDPGWQVEGEWEYGIPSGRGGTMARNPDPTSGATGQHVYGVNLQGDFDVMKPLDYYLTAGPFDFSNATRVQFAFKRWLNSDFPPYAQVFIDVSRDGQNWLNLWETQIDEGIADSAWSDQSYDISAYADGESTIFVRWGYSTTDIAWYHSGWNIDDVLFFEGQNPPGFLLETDASGGVIFRDPDVLSYPPNSEVSLSAFRHGKTFMGWTGDVPVGHEMDNPLLLVMDADKFLKANYETVYYTLMVNATQGTVLREPDSQWQAPGSAVTLTAVPDEHYRFIRWSGDVPPENETANPLVLTMDANKTVTAEFGPYPTVSVRATIPFAYEKDLVPGELLLKRTEPLDDPVTVSFLWRGKAVKGMDYRAVTPPVTLAAGVEEMRISIRPRSDLLAEGDERVTLRIVSKPEYAVGTPISATVIIIDDPPPTGAKTWEAYR